MRYIPENPFTIFLLMFLAALVFGLSSYNLFFLIKANLALVIDYGLMALKDGAFSELVKLFIYGLVSLLSYLLFKACEKVLVEWLTQKKSDQQ